MQPIGRLGVGEVVFLIEVAFHLKRRVLAIRVLQDYNHRLAVRILYIDCLCHIGVSFDVGYFLLLVLAAHQVFLDSVGATLVKPPQHIKAVSAILKAEEVFLNLVIVVHWDFGKGIPKLSQGHSAADACIAVIAAVVGVHTEDVENLFGVYVDMVNTSDVRTPALGTIDNLV
jgi:hypothetical protein